jgi:hypothetical protein
VTDGPVIREPGPPVPRRNHMRRTVTVAAIVLFAVAACGRQGRAPANPDAAFQNRARAVADAWRATLAGGAGQAWRTGLIPLQDLTLAPERGLTDETRFAFQSGWYSTRVDLSAGAPPAGTVTFEDRSTLAVPLVSARDAYAQLHMGDSPCRGNPAPAGTPGPSGSGPGGSVGAPAQHTCASLTVTAATLGTATLQTSRGPATVPAWLFTVAELPVPVARVAVAVEALSPPPRPAIAPDDQSRATGLVAARKLTSADETRLGYTIAIGACDHNAAGLAYETADVVVIGGTVERSTGGKCPDLLRLEPVSASLTKPLGARVVLDALSGQPLILTATGR